jgi:hypothetical protein
MKKMKIAFAAITLLLATSAFAGNGPEKVPQKVKTEFQKNFTGASKVIWEKNDDFYFAHFEMDTKDVDAAYNEEGELLGVSRVIAANQLPLNVSTAIAKKYEGYTVANTVTEVTYEGQTSYYINVVSSKQALKLKCSSNGDIMVEKKSKK